MRGMPTITRRELLLSLPALAIVPRALAQATDPPIRVRALNHMTLAVSDPKRSLEFYQGLFGMPIQARQGATTLLRIGSGPQFLALSATAANAAPEINHFCLTVEGFNVDRIVKLLADRGVTRADANGPMKVRVRMRGPEAGGAKEGTPELYFGDPDGIVVQLQDASYCGGAGVPGNMCAAPEPSPKKGLLAVRDLSHFTINVVERRNGRTRFTRSSSACRSAPTRDRRRSSASDRRVQFLMFTGGAGAARGSERRAAASAENRSRLPEHGRVRSGQDSQIARGVRHQAERQHARPGGSAEVVRDDADGEPRRRTGRDAGAVLHGSRRHPRSSFRT